MGQTRNTHDVSVHGEVYDRVRTYCRERGVTIGPEVSTWVEEHFDRMEAQPAEEQPLEEEQPRHEPRLTKEELEAETRKHFTF